MITVQSQEQLQKLWIRFSFVTCHEHTGLDLKGPQALPGPPALTACAKPSSWVQIFRRELIPRWALGLQHPQLSPWVPPTSSAPAGMSGPSCSCFRTLFYTKKCSTYTYISFTFLCLNLWLIWTANGTLKKIGKHRKGQEGRNWSAHKHINIPQYSL